MLFQLQKNFFLEIIYFHTDYHVKSESKIINCFDPIIKIKWPLKFKLVSKKDMNQKFIKKNFQGI